MLHPEEGDQVTRSSLHQRRWHYLREVFERQVADDPTAVVLDDVRIEWDVPDLEPHSPESYGYLRGERAQGLEHVSRC